MVNVENLVEEPSDMKSKTVFLLLCQRLGILAVEYPSSLGEGEFQLVTIICGVV